MVVQDFDRAHVYEEEATTHIEEPRRRTVLELETEDPEVPFDHDEWHKLHEEDNAAGARISRILSSLFLYSCVIMVIVFWWTWQTSH